MQEVSKIAEEVHRQGRIQDLAQGGDKSGARKIFCPPPELLRGGTGGGTEFCTLLRFCTIYIMSLQENIKKKIFVPPPESLRGGAFWLSPP